MSKGRAERTRPTGSLRLKGRKNMEENKDVGMPAQAVRTGGAGKKMSTKDYVTVGVFALLHAAVLFIMGAIGGLSAVGFPLFGLVGFIPGGIIFVYIVTKVPKRGVVFALGAISALAYFLMGAYGPVPLFVLAAGIVGEAVVSAGKYKSFSLIVVGYVLFALLFWFGFMSPIAFSMEGYMDSAIESYGADYMATLAGYVQGPLLIALGATTAVGAVAGTLLGRRLFAKHFSRIGG